MATIPKSLQYDIFDPTGNITALVSTPVEMADQPAVAASIMERDPTVEQVGFVSVSGPTMRCVRLRMAGGEFCGNATMCAAALWHGMVPSDEPVYEVDVEVMPDDERRSLIPVEVRPEGDVVLAGLTMPPIHRITEERLFGPDREAVPFVRMEGIAHAVIESSALRNALLSDPACAEQAVKKIGSREDVQGVGLMFLEKTEEGYGMRPLVYVPHPETLCWEHSCASGTAAVASVLAMRAGTKTEVGIEQPGGTLRAISDPDTGTIRLYGQVRLIERYGL